MPNEVPGFSGATNRFHAKDDGEPAFIVVGETVPLLGRPRVMHFAGVRRETLVSPVPADPFSKFVAAHPRTAKNIAANSVGGNIVGNKIVGNKIGGNKVGVVNLGGESSSEEESKDWVDPFRNPVERSASLNDSSRRWGLSHSIKRINQRIKTFSTSSFTNEGNEEAAFSRQLLAAFAGNMGSMAFGSVLAWTSPALPDIRQSMVVDRMQESWIGSIMLLGAVLACPVTGWAMERLGRRMTMILLTPPFVAGWIAICLAQDVLWICVGRLVTGMCAGAFSLVAPVYVSETADPSVRGFLASGFIVMLNLGILFIFVVGTYVSWKSQALICSTLPAIAFFLLLLVPESPRYLVEKERETDALAALMWLHATPLEGPHAKVQDELKQIKKSVEESEGKRGSWADLLSKDVLKPTLICMAVMFFVILSGIDAIMFFTVDIFRSAGSTIDDNICTNIVGTVQVIATVMAANAVDRCGRRLLLILSSTFIVLSLGTLGLFFFLKSKGMGEDLHWLPLVSLAVYVVAFCLGLGPVPWILMGELIPAHVKGLTAGVITVFTWFISFLITLTFQDMMSLLGDAGGYWLFALITLLGTLFMFFLVPETKGRSLDEIQQTFQ